MRLRALDPVGQAVELLAGVFRGAEADDAEHGFGVIEHLEADALRDWRHVLELHAEAEVWLVDAVFLHGLVVGHAREVADLAVENGLEEVANEALERVEDVLLLDEAHLAVHLGELGLAVGAQVFVAEALDDLVVLVESAHHQQLLEGLRALRQGVELAGVHAARHHEVAAPSGVDLIRTGVSTSMKSMLSRYFRVSMLMRWRRNRLRWTGPRRRSR